MRHKLVWYSCRSLLWSIVLLAACEGEGNPDSGAFVADAGSPNDGTPDRADTLVENDAAPAVENDAAPDTALDRVPCTPLSMAEAPVPTAGVCDGNTARTCGQDGFLTDGVCDEGFACRTYEIQEWIFFRSPWSAGRLLTWAGCVPTDAVACDRRWNGNYYDGVERPYCEGANRVSCGSPPVPDLSSSWPQTQTGTESGWLVTLPCPEGDTCIDGGVGNSLVCLDSATAACDGTEPFCDGSDIIDCRAGRFRARNPCIGLGRVCYEGTTGQFCGQSGETRCDPATFVPVCSDRIVTCRPEGWTETSDCTTCRGAGGVHVPCQCARVSSVSGWTGVGAGATCREEMGLACVPREPACDPSVDSDWCEGTLAHHCSGASWQTRDCASSGMICDVGGGRSGCRLRDAVVCTSDQAFCDGDTLVDCCTCGQLGFPFGRPCVPGFEGRTECSEGCGGSFPVRCL